jgi:hypothetical protein
MLVRVNARNVKRGFMLVRVNARNVKRGFMLVHAARTWARVDRVGNCREHGKVEPFRRVQGALPREENDDDTRARYQEKRTTMTPWRAKRKER